MLDVGKRYKCWQRGALHSVSCTLVRGEQRRKPKWVLTKPIFFFSLNFIYSFFIQQVLITYLFYIYQCIYVNPNLPVHPTATPPPLTSRLVSIGLFSASVSPPLPCKLVHLYHFSRFHIYVLIYDICFSLSDLQSLSFYKSFYFVQVANFTLDGKSYSILQ